MESILLSAGAVIAGVHDHSVDHAGTLVGVWTLLMILLTFAMRYFKRQTLKKLSRSVYSLLTGKLRAGVKIPAVHFDLADSVCAAALHSLELSSKHLGLLVLSKIESTELLTDAKHSLSPATAAFCQQLASDSLSSKSAKNLQSNSKAFQDLVYKQLRVVQRRTILQVLSLLQISALLAVGVVASVTNHDQWILFRMSTYESLVSELRDGMSSIEKDATLIWMQTAFDSAIKVVPNSSMFGVALTLLFALVGIDSLHQLQVSTYINQAFMEMLHELRAAKTRLVEQQIDENKVPIGTIIAYAANVPNDGVLPFGWLPCDGRALEINAFKQLFDVIKNLHGFGDDESEQNHFNLPDFRGYFLRGADEDGLVDNDAESRTPLGNGKPTDVGSVQDDGLKEHDHNGVTELAHGGVWFDKIWHDIPHYEPKEDWSPNCTGGGFPEHPFHRDPKYQGDEFKHQHEIRKDGIAETRPKNKYVVFLIRVA